MYASTKDQAIDESMIAFKGRSSLKQYMPQKPIKRGYKVWVRADAYGYICKFQIYTGKNKDTQEIEQNLGGIVVLDLCEDLNFKNYTVYFDNFFSSPNLMKDMMFKKINGCGTVRSNRKEFPKCFSADKKMKKGDYEWRSTITGITAMKWVDKKPIHLISNFHNPNELNTITRKEKDGTKKVITCPQLIKDYNIHMGYVDKADQLKSTYEIDRKSRKWWHRIFFHFLDVTVVNSYILFSLGDDENKKNALTLKEFRLHLAAALVSAPDDSSTKAQRKKAAPIRHKPYIIPEKRFLGAHLPVGSTSRRCNYCSTKAAPRRTSYKCSKCDVPLGVSTDVKKNCFFKYHE